MSKQCVILKPNLDQASQALDLTQWSWVIDPDFQFLAPKPSRLSLRSWILVSRSRALRPKFYVVVSGTDTVNITTCDKELQLKYVQYIHIYCIRIYTYIQYM